MGGGRTTACNSCVSELSEVDQPKRIRSQANLQRRLLGEDTSCNSAAAFAAEALSTDAS